MIDELLHKLGVTTLTIQLECDEESWFVQVKELPGCMSQGDTIEEAMAMTQDAMRGWLTVAVEDGDEILLPAAEE